MRKPTGQVEENFFFPDGEETRESIEAKTKNPDKLEYLPDDSIYIREIFADISRKLDNLEFERRQAFNLSNNPSVKDITFFNWLKTEHKNRSMRRSFFRDEYLFGEPGWDILIDLCAAEIEGKRISITSSCFASGVASTTALRWLQVLQKDGYLERLPDDGDKRRVWIRISEMGFRSLASYYKRVILGIRERKDMDFRD